MPFFHYSQNNTGGEFEFTENVDHHVVVEADSPVGADEKAQTIGIYFDGCSDGRDCHCCGDRWFEVYGAGDPVPSVYGAPVEESEKSMWSGTLAIVHYADGTRKRFKAGV